MLTMLYSVICHHAGESTNVLANAIWQNDRNSIKRSDYNTCPILIKRVSLWKPGTLFKIANGKMKCARDRAGCGRSLEAYVKQSPKMRRLRAVSLLSWSVEQNARDTQMTTRVTEGARRERLLPLFLASRYFAAQCSRARPLPLLNLKKKRDCSQSSVFIRQMLDGRFTEINTCPITGRKKWIKRTSRANSNGR